jgi:hypothetical protein
MCSLAFELLYLSFSAPRMPSSSLLLRLSLCAHKAAFENAPTRNMLVCVYLLTCPAVLGFGLKAC